MLEGKAVIGETDMLQTMQQDALDLASKALDFFDVTEATEIAQFIKKEFDRVYGPGCYCWDGFWIVCDALLWMFHPFLRWEPCDFAIQGFNRTRG
ncbi:UNVERIFIED_CONTAM: hypothetical protein Slati_2070900 [Sesamum latifolium]|uniref:Dynein light chain n=1 Tax=Sesamum latifolium TaxID=2727402 RepID=A0AAW2WP67_9LAMI